MLAIGPRCDNKQDVVASEMRVCFVGGSTQVCVCVCAVEQSSGDDGGAAASCPLVDVRDLQGDGNEGTQHRLSFSVLSLGVSL